MTLQTRLELSNRALKAMKRAAANVLKEHRLTDDPIYMSCGMAKLSGFLLPKLVEKDIQNEVGIYNQSLKPINCHC